MGLLGILLSIYFILLLIRAVVPDTGQMAFNQPYRLVVKVTDPVIVFSARLLPSRFRRLAAVPAIGLLILVQAMIFMRGTGLPGGVLTWGFIPWAFNTASPFWGLGAATAYYLILSYRVFAFLLLIVLISPDVTSDQVSRLIKTLVQPPLRAVRSRRTAAVVLPLAFTVAMAGIWRLYQAAGWLAGEGAVIARTLVNSLFLPLQLTKVIIYLIFFQAVLSWFNAARSSVGPFSWLEFFVEPFLRPLRRFHLVWGRIDLTPLAAILALWFFRQIVERILLEIYQNL